MLNEIIILIAIIVLGYIARAVSLISKELEKELSNFVYYIAMPCLIFVSLANTIITEQHLEFLFLNSLTLSVAFTLVYLLYELKTLKGKFAATLMLCLVFGNVIFMGFPVAQAAFGQEAISDVAVIAFVYNLFIFTLGLYLFSLMTHKDNNTFAFQKLATNTVLYACMIGASISVLNIDLPAIVIEPLSLIGQTTIPLALFAMGAFLYEKKAGSRPEVVILFVAKMVCLPLILLCVALLVGADKYVFRLSFLEASMPIAVTSFVIAREFSLDAELVAEATVATTIASIPMILIIGEMVV